MEKLNVIVGSEWTTVWNDDANLNFIPVEFEVSIDGELIDLDELIKCWRENGN